MHLAVETNLTKL